MQRSESRRKAELSTFSDEGIEGQLEKILLSFRQKIHGILGSVIADSNGLTVASDVKGGVSSSVLSAMSTLIAQSGARVFENIQMHGPTFIIMDGDQANVAVVQFADGGRKVIGEPFCRNAVRRRAIIDHLLFGHLTGVLARRHRRRRSVILRAPSANRLRMNRRF